VANGWLEGKEQKLCTALVKSWNKMHHQLQNTMLKMTKPGAICCGKLCQAMNILNISCRIKLTAFEKK